MFIGRFLLSVNKNLRKQNNLLCAIEITLFSICWYSDWQNHIAKFSKMASLNQIIHKKNKTSRSFAKNKKKKFHPWHCILSDLKALRILWWGLHCKKWPFTIFGRYSKRILQFSLHCIVIADNNGTSFYSSTICETLCN